MGKGLDGEFRLIPRKPRTLLPNVPLCSVQCCQTFPCVSFTNAISFFLCRPRVHWNIKDFIGPEEALHRLCKPVPTKLVGKAE